MFYTEQDGVKYGAMGMLNTSWDDRGEEFFSYTWYGFAWSAECAWHPSLVELGQDPDAERDRRQRNFTDSFDSVFYGLEDNKAASALLGEHRMADNELNRSAEPRPVGKTKEAQQHNESLLSGYDYAKYPSGITGYTGQDLQRIMIMRYEEAVRTRIGPRGNYKAGLTRLADGRLLAAVCRPQMDKDKPGNKIHMIYMYRSDDEGLTWQELPETGIIGK